MRQPPDEPDRADTPGHGGDRVDAVVPEGADPTASTPDAPTVPWTPPPGASDPAPPLEPTARMAPSGASSTPPPDAYDAAPRPDPASPGASADEPSPAGPFADRPNPLISWSPSGGAAASPAAGEAGDPAVGPLVGWQVQPQRPVETPAGYALAGVFPRVVAYLIDAVLATLVPTVLALFLIDYGPVVRDAIDQAIAEQRTGVPATGATLPLTLELVLTTVISTAISYLYFVGFWTSGGQATPGMRGLRLRVVDVARGSTLSLTQATKRWIGLGAPLALLALIGPLQGIAGLVQLGVSLLLLITAATDDRKQGLHDRWADSIVIRSRSSAAGATAVGCVVLVLLWIGFATIVTVLALDSVLPELLDALERTGGLR